MKGQKRSESSNLEDRLLTRIGRYTLSDALAVAVWLNVFIRQARHIGMANIAQSVNVISPLTTTRDGIIKQPTWWPLLLFSKFMRGSALAVHVACAEYEGPTEPAWIRGTVSTPWLDVSASIGEDGMATLAVVNMHRSKAFVTTIEGIPDGSLMTVHTVTGPHVEAVNTVDQQDVQPTIIHKSSVGSFEFPAHSLTLLCWMA
jgi:alpha-N-arabinofuranosidase